MTCEVQEEYHLALQKERQTGADAKLLKSTIKINVKTENSEKKNRPWKHKSTPWFQTEVYLNTEYRSRKIDKKIEDKSEDEQ